MAKDAIQVTFEPAEAPEIGQTANGLFWISWRQVEITHIPKELAREMLRRLMAAVTNPDPTQPDYPDFLK